MKGSSLISGLIGVITGAFGIIILLIIAVCCSSNSSSSANDSTTIVQIDTLRDTIFIDHLPEGSFTYNIPCRAVNLNQDQEGKSLLFIWLHGGVSVPNLHSLRDWNHLNCCMADDYILDYLSKHKIKSIALFPICHKANITHCIPWKDCFDDVKAMIDDYVSKGLVDEKRIYLAGSSDGGTGAWDYAESHGDIFAAIMPMSCGNPRMSSAPVYFFNTRSESNCTQLVENLNNRGAHIKYKHCAGVGHGGDAEECTDNLLNEFFANQKN